LADAAAAVVSVKVGMAWDMFTEAKALYAPYHQQVAAGVRAPAALDDDRHRGAVDQLLYGSHSGRVVYAVLSPSGAGLASYGSIHLELEDKAIEHRSTVLEENSYRFVERHKIAPGKPFPKGYLATWRERGKLAASKLSPQLRSGMTKGEFESLLLLSTGKRDTDSFMEIHVYGTFNYQAVRRVKISATTAAPGHVAVVETTLAKGLMEQLDALKVPWSG
jgi:hypothetical protein